MDIAHQVDTDESDLNHLDREMWQFLSFQPKYIAFSKYILHDYLTQFPLNYIH